MTPNPKPDVQSEPGAIAMMERLTNPHGLQVVGDRLVARCKACDGRGMSGAFYCGNCNGAGVVEVRGA